MVQYEALPLACSCWSAGRITGEIGVTCTGPDTGSRFRSDGERAPLNGDSLRVDPANTHCAV
jgi:hypothetical protein